MEVGVSGGEGGGEADFAAGGGAATEGGAQAGGVVDGDLAAEVGKGPLPAPVINQPRPRVGRVALYGCGGLNRSADTLPRKHPLMFATHATSR